MSPVDFTRTLTTSKTPAEVFQTVLEIRNWWSGLFAETFEGQSAQLNDEFTFSAGGGAHYSKQKLVELIPNQKLVWEVVDSKLNFLKKQNEWTGTKLVFEISESGAQTILRFTHEGLTPASECYDNCSPAWSQYFHDKLLPLLNGVAV